MLRTILASRALLPRRLKLRPLATVTFSSEQKALLKDKLVELRTQIAEDENKQHYRVFPNTVIEALVDSPATTAEELRSIKGIGPVRMEMYGDELLALVRLVAGGVESADGSGSAAALSARARRPAAAEVETALLNEEQRAAVASAADGSNLFLTGAGGVGKSFCLRAIVSDLRQRRGLRGRHHWNRGGARWGPDPALLGGHQNRRGHRG